MEKTSGRATVKHTVRRQRGPWSHGGMAAVFEK